MPTKPNWGWRGPVDLVFGFSLKENTRGKLKSLGLSEDAIDELQLYVAGARYFAVPGEPTPAQKRMHLAEMKKHATGLLEAIRGMDLVLLPMLGWGLHKQRFKTFIERGSDGKKRVIHPTEQLERDLLSVLQAIETAKKLTYEIKKRRPAHYLDDRVCAVLEGCGISIDERGKGLRARILQICLEAAQLPSASEPRNIIRSKTRLGKWEPEQG